VSRLDVFPEEFETFLLVSDRIRAAFMRHHPDLFDAEFWQNTQQQVRDGAMQDFFPYPEALRFCNLYSGARSD
jgi:isocitrate dehydrogenase kinase/phosphatase